MPIPWIPQSPLDRFLATQQQRQPAQTATPVPWAEAPVIERSVRPPTAPVGATIQPMARPAQTAQPPAMRQPTTITQTVAPTSTTTPAATPAEQEVISQDKPFWARALDVFAAPFNWIDDYIIKPGLSTLAAPVIPDLKREVGEDYWAWKKREWEAWQAPGIDLDMPWGKWRVDVKGIAELAPWLLIPGAGAVTRTVGGVVKAGSGIAGALEKLGKAGQIAGKAVQYSPWGLVEQGAAWGIGGAAKAVSGASAKVGARVGEKFVGKMPEKVIAPEVEKFAVFLEEAVIPARKKFEAALPKLRDAQTKVVSDIQDGVRSGRITAREATKLENQALARVGKLKEDFALGRQVLADDALPDPKMFTGDDAERLLQKARSSVEKDMERKDVAEALENLLEQGIIPEPRHFEAFAEIFGDRVGKALGELSKTPKGVLAKMLDLANIPRASLSSVDISATFRQGLILGLTHPRAAIRAFPRQLKAFASEKLAMDMDAVLKADPLYPEFLKSGGYIAPLEKAAKWSKMEESFASKAAEHIPFVRRSERGFITYLNELRMASYKSARNSWVAQGAGDAELKMLAKFINNASGRGELPMGAESIAPILNTFMFSPRLQMSRIELPVILGKMLFSDKPYMRKEAARALVTFLGGGSAVLGLINQSGIGTVELDPRSSDFAKVKVGDTRFDIWTGYAQYARFLAQMVTGEKKQAFGNMTKQERLEVASRFLQSKASPAAGLLLDLLKGEDYAGNPLAKDTTGLIENVKRKMMPLVLQDVMDAMEMDGVNALSVTTGAAAALGIGVLAYVDEFTKKRNEIARQYGYETWSQIDPIKQKELEKLPVLQEAAIEYDRRMMGTVWGEWHAAGRAAEQVFAEDVEKASAKYRLDGDGIAFRQDINEAFAARRGAYAARQKNESFEEIVARFGLKTEVESLVKVGAEQMAIKTYEDALFGDDMFDQFGDYRFDEAEVRKAELLTKLGQELYDYVEEYRGLKYQDLPAEYHELAKAKVVLKPYWGIQDEAERYFGVRDTPAKLRFIARRRKIMKRTNREIEYYYNLFYNRQEV